MSGESAPSRRDIYKMMFKILVKETGFFFLVTGISALIIVVLSSFPWVALALLGAIVIGAVLRWGYLTLYDAAKSRLEYSVSESKTVRLDYDRY